MKRTTCRTEMPQRIAGVAALVAPPATASGSFGGHSYGTTVHSAANRTDARRPLGLEKAPPD